MTRESARPDPEMNNSQAALSSLSSARIFIFFFILGVILYFQSLGCAFVWDEYTLILSNASSGNFEFKNLPDLFTQEYFHRPTHIKKFFPKGFIYYRPVTVLTHALTYKAAGLFFPVFHLESLLLHTLNALMLFILFSTILSNSATSFPYMKASLVGALLFFVHPRNVETVCIIANQTGLLCAFFSLLSLCCWAKVLKGSSRPFLLYSLSLFSLLLAMLSKETAFIVPVVHTLVFLLAYEPDEKTPSRSFHDTSRHSGKLRSKLTPQFMVHLITGNSLSDYFSKKGKKSLLQLCGYFLLLAIPLSIIHFHLQGPSVMTSLKKQISSEVTWGMIFLTTAVCIGLVWLLWKDKRLLTLGIGWFLIFYLPTSNLVSIGTMPGGGLKAGAHHLYPAHAGLCLLVAAVFFLPGRRSPKTSSSPAFHLLPSLLIGIIILFLSLQTFRFSANYRNPDRFYQGILEINPMYAGAWKNYAWHKLYIEKKTSHRRVEAAPGDSNCKGRRL